MGAYGIADWSLDVAGVPSPGAILAFNVNGPPSAKAPYSVGLLDVNVFIPPYGFLLTGVSGAGLAGMRFGVQAGAFSTVDPTHQGITNLYRGRIRP